MNYFHVLRSGNPAEFSVNFRHSTQSRNTEVGKQRVLTLGSFFLQFHLLIKCTGYSVKVKNPKQYIVMKS